MKNRPTHLRLALLTAGFATAQATDITWDVSTDAGTQGGAGTWDTIATHWTTDDGASNIAWNNITHASDTAVFSAGNGIVTVDGEIHLGGIAITSPTGSSIGGRNNVGYVFNGGTLRFGALKGDIDITAAQTTLQINSNLAGSGGLTLRSAGGDAGDNPWIVLNGDNSGLTGGITITSGLVAFTSQAAAGDNTIALENGGIFGPVNHSGTGTAVTGPNEQELTNPFTVTAFDNRIRVWGSRTLTLSGPLSGDGSIRKVDGGTLALTGDLSGFTGEIVQAAGNLNLDSPYGGGLFAQAGVTNLNAAFTGGLELSGSTVNAHSGFGGTLDFRSGTLNITGGTFASDISFNTGNLTIASGATVDGDISAAFGAGTLNVFGTVDGNLFIDEDVNATFSAGTVTGDLTAGDPAFNPSVKIRQTDGPIEIGGTLKVNGTLEIEADGSVAPGQPLVTYANVVTGPGNPGASIQVAGVDQMRNGATTVGATAISYTSAPATITWTGAESAAWDTNLTANWDLGGNAETFFLGDSVVFPADATVTDVIIDGPQVVGNMSVAGDSGYSFTGGGLGGSGTFTKTGYGTVTFNQTAGNGFTGGFQLNEGSVSILSNQQATGTGPLVLSSGTALSAFPAGDTATITFGNPSIAMTGALWNLGGSSAGTVTHTYNFAGAIGSDSETDPATAIQITDSSLILSSTNGTTKTFNGRIRWSGTNTIQRTSSAFTHGTIWNRAWYGDGTVIINKTGGATGRSMTFNGAGSTFSGVLVLNQTEASGGNAPVFQLNQPLPAAAIEVANRWVLTNNTPGGLDDVGEIFVFDAASRLNLAQPVNNPDLDLDLGNGTLSLGDAPSTVGTIDATNATILSGGANSALTVTGGSGSVFAGTIDLEADNTLSVTSSGIGFGTQTIGGLTQNAGTVVVGFDPTGANVATISGAYVHTGGKLVVHLTALPQTGQPYTVLNFGSRTGTPTVEVTGLEGSSLTAAVSYGANSITLTFSGSAADLVWSGTTDDLWDTTTPNWLKSGTPSAYTQFDSVTFDDTATGSTSIFLDTEVTPGGVVFNHSTVDYAVTGFGSISGGTTLTKEGTGVLTLGTQNSYTGGTSVTGGRVRAGSNTAFGAGPVSVASASVSSDGTEPRTLANAFTLTGTATFGDATDTGTLTLTGPISGAGTLLKTGPGGLTLSPSAANTLAGVTVAGGTLTVGTNQQATGSGPLLVSPGATLSSYGPGDNITVTFANAPITVNNATWTFGGSSSGNVTHTYNFTGGEIGSDTATDPATAIQVSGGTLTLSSSNSTSKVFNGRIRWSGDNVINRTTGNFTHGTTWNRAWYGDGSITINMTGTATGRSMTFAGAGSTFSGSLILGATTASGGNDPSFNLNQPLPASNVEVRNRWNLVHNTADGFAPNATVTLVDEASKLTLTQPVNRPGLALVVHAGTIATGTGDSTVGSLTVGGVLQPAGTYNSGNSPFITGEGNLIVLGGSSATGYNDWLASFGLTPGAPGTGAEESFDGSGVANVVQYFLGGDPTDPADNGTHHVFTQDSNGNDGLILTIAVPAGATFAGSPSPTASVEDVTCTIQGGTTLSDWDGLVEEIAVQHGGSLTAPAGYVLKSFRLVQNPALGSKGFLRVSVTQP